MKKIGLMVAVVLLAGSALAQMRGAPVGGGVAGPEDEMIASGGMLISSDIMAYGLRFSWRPIAEVKVFGDLGYLDPDDVDGGLSIQGGGQYTFPIGDAVPIDLGVRASVGFAPLDEVDLYMLNAGIIGSMDIAQFTPYAYLGLDYSKMKYSGPYGHASEDETNLSLAVGTTLTLTEIWGLYGEFGYCDEGFFAFGARYTF